MEYIQVVCPLCGSIYWRWVEREYLALPYAWKRAGYHVINCDDCRKDIKSKQEALVRW